jgi:DNA-binding XRE family transcriptional regulator
MTRQARSVHVLGGTERRGPRSFYLPIYYQIINFVLKGANKMRGEIIRKIRQLNGKTQEDVAKVLGVSRGAIQQIETNRMKMSEKLRRKFVQAFDVQPETIEFIQRF